ncbi:MAG TPA: hypothetical protein PKJ07_01290 [Bacteroidales bacterium]|jgi:hypothetical protein|nr:hypothetical protein [Bacteroidales bacterium]HOB26768.1 hypothetical protein [Bacteroidales bacterium]HOK21317.1 hypothetical protein [Bacteroidales bacterium]HOL74068.1 hypothetical protein [Bacteroidales bacterium]HPU46452.1 hypothetical protein [Bacteroidales bacterium]
MGKKFISFFLMATILLALPSCKKINTNKVIEFNNKLVDDQQTVLQHEAKLYFAIYESKPTDTLRILLREYQTVLDTIIKKYEKPFKVEDTFRQGALELFRVYNDIAKNTYPQLISLLDSANEGAAIESQKIIDLMMMIDSTEDMSNKKLLNLQQYVMDKYKI